MKNEIKYAFYLLGLGMTLIAYAHATFATKHQVDSNSDYLKRIDDRVYKIMQHHKIHD